MFIEDTTQNTPIGILYQAALTTYNQPILDELSMDHVISVFRDYIAQNADLDLLTNTKFGTLLLQRISTPTSKPDIYFFLPKTGLELCYFLLDDLALDIYWNIMQPLISSHPVTSESIEHVYPCSSEHEQIIMEQLMPFLNHFPLTKAILFDSIINYPQRLYI